MTNGSSFKKGDSFLSGTAVVKDVADLVLWEGPFLAGVVVYLDDPSVISPGFTDVITDGVLLRLTAPVRHCDGLQDCSFDTIVVG